MKADRGIFLDGFLNEKTYALVDELEVIAKAHDSTVARVRSPGCRRSRE